VLSEEPAPRARALWGWSPHPHRSPLFADGELPAGTAAAMYTLSCCTRGAGAGTHTRTVLKHNYTRDETTDDATLNRDRSK
jgi:hypothetical protein